jgi:RNA polymerase sigma factor (sigma-70 family)
MHADARFRGTDPTDPIDPMDPLSAPAFPELDVTDWAAITRLAVEVARRCLPEDPDAADDLAQEAMIKLLLVPYPPRSLATWLWIALERSSADLRRRWHAEQRSQAGLDPSPAWQAPACERRLLVREILAVLPARTRRLLVLYANGYSYDELARASGCSKQPLARRLRRALGAARRAAEAVPPRTRRALRAGASLPPAGANG